MGTRHITNSILTVRGWLGCSGRSRACGRCRTWFLRCVAFTNSQGTKQGKKGTIGWIDETTFGRVVYDNAPQV
jgi:hypothetical protein